jgi:hypothetical protein
VDIGEHAVIRIAPPPAGLQADLLAKDQALIVPPGFCGKGLATLRRVDAEVADPISLFVVVSG